MAAGVGALVVSGGLLAIWRLVGDGSGGGVCPAVLPAPPGCADRSAFAVTWTAVLLTGYITVVVLTVAARSRTVRVTGVGLLLLGMLVVVAYQDTLWTGTVG